MKVHLGSSSMTTEALIAALFLILLAIVCTRLVCRSLQGLAKGRAAILVQGAGSLLALAVAAGLLFQGKPSALLGGSLVLGWAMGMGDVMWLHANSSTAPGMGVSQR